MATWLNHVTIAGPRNATSTHTVTPSAGTAVAGSLFTPTAGRLLVVLVEGGVTSTTPSGWSLPTGGSAVNNTGLYLWYRTAAGSDSLTTTHNGANYPVVFDFYEFAAGTTFLASVAATAVADGGAGPTLTGLTGTNWVAGVVGASAGAAATAGSVTWSAGVEAADTGVLTSGTDGYTYGLTYFEDSTAASVSAAATILPTPGVSAERLVFAVRVASTGAGAVVATAATATARANAPTLGSTVLAARATATAAAPSGITLSFGPASTLHLFTTQTPGSVGTDDTYTLGTVLYPTSAGVTVTAGRYYKSGTTYNGLAVSMGLWDSAGTLLASGTRTQQVSDADGWVEVPFTSSAALSTTDTYTVGYQAPVASYQFATGGLTSAVINGQLRTDPSAGRFTRSSTLTRPTTGSSTNYFADVSATSTGASVTAIAAVATTAARAPSIGFTTTVSGGGPAIATALARPPVVGTIAIAGVVTAVRATATAQARRPSIPSLAVTVAVKFIAPDGSPAILLGWWDGTSVQPVDVAGYWDGVAVKSLA